MILESQYRRRLLPLLPKFPLELDDAFSYTEKVEFVDTYRVEPGDQENTVPSSECQGM